MAKEDIASSGSQLFADKGRARPASGLRSIFPEADHDEDPQIPAVPTKPPDSSSLASEEGELTDAASLQAGGFKTAIVDEPEPPKPDVGTPDAGKVPQETPVSSLAAAGPAHIDTALAEAVSPSTDARAADQATLFARSARLHPLVIGAAFAALLLASLGIGYGISLIAGGGSAKQGDSAPAEASRSEIPRPAR